MFYYLSRKYYQLSFLKISALAMLKCAILHVHIIERKCLSAKCRQKNRNYWSDSPVIVWLWYVRRVVLCLYGSTVLKKGCWHHVLRFSSQINLRFQYHHYRCIVFIGYFKSICPYLQNVLLKMIALIQFLLFYVNVYVYLESLKVRIRIKWIKTIF